MSIDASLPPNAPMTNGLETQPEVHGEDDASPRPAATPAQASSLEAVCEDIHRRIAAFLDKPPDSDLRRRVQEQTRTSIGVIEKALNDYDFSTLSLSYNGGKDCLVLLLLYLSTLHTHFKSSPKTSTANSTSRPSFPNSIPSIYAQTPDPFPAITNFVTTSSKRYHLDLYTIRTNPRPSHHQHQHHHSDLDCYPHIPAPVPSSSSSPNSFSPVTHDAPPSNPEKRITFRDAFATYLSPNPTTPSSTHNQSHPEIQAIFVGTRRSDPHGSSLTHFDRTDHGWPDFMRIHPVINWRLSEIWYFLRADELRESDGRRLPYCEMYDEGYTSLGGVGDTIRNPSLKYVSGEGREGYRPAYELTEDGEERLGRV